MSTLIDPDAELFDKESVGMVLGAKNGYWDTVWDILDRKPYLVNCIPKERAWAILHQAVWWKHEEAVVKILAVPGCDSELLTKNGLTPLDIETTPEIITLLKQHIAQMNDWEETPEEEIFDSSKIPPLNVGKKKSKYKLKTKSFKSGTVPETKYSEAKPNDFAKSNGIKSFEEQIKIDDQNFTEVSKHAKKRNWKEVFSMLDKWKNLINKVDRVTGMATLHYIAEANNVQHAQKILQYPACDPGVKTLENSPYGAGKTAAEITTSPEVRAAIRWKESKLQQSHFDEPAFVSINDSNLILMNYMSQAMEEHRDAICNDGLNLEFLQLFPEMGWFVFDFVNSGDTNWKKAKDVIAREIYNFDATKRLLADKDSFFKELVKCYTGNSLYPELNKELRNQAIHTNQSSKTKYKAYSAVMNALLFQNFLDIQNPIGFTGMTFRGMKLSDENLLNKYQTGQEFAWLAFTSSSGTRTESEEFGNCLFEIDNSQSCAWSPRKISSISEHYKEDEYLYPCGAQFRVTKVKKGTPTVIKMKLICKEEPRPYLPITNNLTIHTGAIKETMTPLKEKREEFDESKNRLHKICLKIEKNKNFTSEIIENKVRREMLNSKEAYHCRKCNFTCHYPCPDKDIVDGCCVVSGPIAEGRCQNCPKKCLFSLHRKVRFRIIIKSRTETNEDEKMKATFEKTKEEEKAEEAVLETIHREFTTLAQNTKTKFDEWDVMAKAFEKMLRTEQASAISDSQKFLDFYTENKIEIQRAKLQFEELQLI